MLESFPLLAIHCITYNQEAYIRQCLDGFVTQKTNFPFIAVVHDDASTDKTAEIIKEFAEKYPSIIKPIYEIENQWSKDDGSLSKAMEAAIPDCVKYIAYCEGDDYWTDSNKLQMQVDFLETNPDYGLCYTKSKVYLQDENRVCEGTIGTYIKDFDDLLFNDNRIPTLTTVIRKNLKDKYESEINPTEKKWLMGDYPQWLYIYHESKIKFFPQPTAVYRILKESMSHSSDISKNVRFYSSRDDIRNYFLHKYTDYKYDFHAETARKYAYNKLYNRSIVVSEFYKADFLSKKDKKLFFISRIKILFFLFRLLYELKVFFF